ncbi:hypothetical protein GCM10009555_017820 [Acrocarpospora macrocephala]|uniref:Uncharacterized protein n=1 Tax=Acrocarpospora macrocephala TaxID=150177 RepID=A0A5M3WH43_9ACTN|nr:hypothetical protein [Acrocarpospora macrocephala]GES07442.1 hypothetical protein Amac_010370 [Acrocarpospora macrocephala]
MTTTEDLRQRIADTIGQNMILRRPVEQIAADVLALPELRQLREDLETETNVAQRLTAINRRLEVRLARVRALHKGPRTDRPGSGCVQCGIVWPCPTSRALDGPPQGPEGESAGPEPNPSRRA